MSCFHRPSYKLYTEIILQLKRNIQFITLQPCLIYYFTSACSYNQELEWFMPSSFTSFINALSLSADNSTFNRTQGRYHKASFSWVFSVAILLHKI